MSTGVGSPSRPPGWIKIAGIGCATALMLTLLVLGAIVAYTFSRFGRELTSLEELDRGRGACGRCHLPSDGGEPGALYSAHADTRPSG